MTSLCSCRVEQRQYCTLCQCNTVLHCGLFLALSFSPVGPLIRLPLPHPSSLQDESNRSGGKWIIRLRKGLASRFWENIILAMLGEQFMVGEEICGAVVSIRFQVLQYCYHSTPRVKLK